MSIRPIDLQLAMQQNQKVAQLKQHELKSIADNENIFAKELEKKYNDDSHRVTDTEEAEKVYFRKKDTEKESSEGKKRNAEDEDEDKSNDENDMGINTAGDSHIDIRI